MNKIDLQIIQYDFQSRTHQAIDLAQVANALSLGHSCWIDLSQATRDSSRRLLTALGASESLVESLGDGSPAGRYEVHPNGIYASLSLPQWTGDRVGFRCIDMVLMKRLFVTLHEDEESLLGDQQELSLQFFKKHAQSIGFLLFELWDRVIASARQVFTRIEGEVDEIQSSLFNDPTDEIFSQVAQVTSQLSELRKHVLHGRDVLDQLASHHSEFIPTTTQPYLQQMVGTMDRITSDLSTERETLAESLTLYMGMVAHRTNRLLQRLTIFSVIFLPLTFICGIYGTNFPLPEYQWPGGIMFFWGVLILIATSMLTLLRLRRIW